MFVRARQELELACKALAAHEHAVGGARRASAATARAAEILEEHNRTFRRLSAAVKERVDRFLLIQDSFRRSEPDDGLRGDAGARSRSILERERDSLHQASGRLDELLMCVQEGMVGWRGVCIGELSQVWTVFAGKRQRREKRWEHKERHWEERWEGWGTLLGACRT